MKEKLIVLGALFPLFLNGCDEKKEYAIHMTFDGDVATRQVVCSENVSDAVRSKLQTLYRQQTDENTFEGSFQGELPNDVGGFGRHVHLSNPMGGIHAYVERFRGDDAQAPGHRG